MTRYALAGRVVCMDPDRRVLPRGVVYVDGARIAAVRDAEESPPDGFQELRPLATRGTIYPGLIELHNHIAYNVLRLWTVPRRFDNRGQWAGLAEYRARVTAPMTVLGRRPELLAALARYVECKCLVAGVTTTQGIALFSNAGAQRYFRGVVRNIEETGDPELPDAATRIADVEARDAARFLERLRRPTRLFLHLSEGTDAAARSHFLALRLADGSWAVTPSLVGIHAAALEGADFRVMAENGAAMVWSPLSNLLLYGATARVAEARRHGVRIGLGADWSVTGSKNLFLEMKVARRVSRAAGGVFSDEGIVAMATCDAAAILRWPSLGSLLPGSRADLLVTVGSRGDPYAALLDAAETDIALVTIDGTPRYGHPGVMRRLGAAGESLRVAGRRRAMDLSQAQADPAVGRLTLAEARRRLVRALARLPELAREMEAGSVAFAVPRADTGTTWFLALDELAGYGAELRPRLPHPVGGEPTGPPLPGSLTEALAVPLSQLVQPLHLDPLTAADDREYAAVLAAEPNLPEFLRDGG